MVVRCLRREQAHGQDPNVVADALSFLGAVCIGYGKDDLDRYGRGVLLAFYEAGYEGARSSSANVSKSCMSSGP